MNALELADELEAYAADVISGEGPFTKHATMLRQQQTEIDALKDKLYLARQSLDIVDGWIGKAKEK